MTRVTGTESQPDASARDWCRGEKSLTHVSGCDFSHQSKPEVISGLFLSEGDGELSIRGAITMPP